MLSHNKINPKVYKISKVVDLHPQGIIKLTFKQDEWDEKRDNLDLMVCNYYDNTGETQIVIPEAEPQNNTLTSYIYTAHVNSDGELQPDLVSQQIRDTEYNKLNIGNIYYFIVEYYTGTVGGEQSVSTDRQTEWKINVADATGLSAKEQKHLDGLMVMETLDDKTISINVKKSKALIGHSFVLTATDLAGESRSTVTLEVIG